MGVGNVSSSYLIFQICSIPIILCIIISDKLLKWKWKPEKIHSIGGEITNDGDFQVSEGNRHSRKGFMNKQFVMNAILAASVKPTLA